MVAIKKEIEIDIIGGLGNQLFQYASAYALAKSQNKKLIIDVSRFSEYRLHPLRLDKLSIDENFTYKRTFVKDIYRKISQKISPFFGGERHYFETDLSFNGALFFKENLSYLNGYFQSEKYFKDYRDELLSALVPRKSLSAEQSELKEKISSRSSVSVHIRRGNYLSDSKALETHGLCDKYYFDRGFERIQGIVNDDNLQVVVFSDDIDWCKSHVRFPTETLYVKGDEKAPEIDMYLMSCCDHNIISNSSFSWWGAWLNQNESKVVVAPKRWFADEKMNSQSYDIVPNEWLRV